MTRPASRTRRKERKKQRAALSDEVAPWSKEWLESLSEDELRNHVLKPLFRRMGFLGILDHHGGALEQGKDIVMWSECDSQERQNYAVVVKAKRITGGSRDAFEVLAQVEQCFAGPFVDKETLQAESVNACWIVSSHEIFSEGTNALKPLLEARGFAGRFRIIDGSELRVLIQKHLQPLNVLREAIGKMPAVHPDWAYQITALPDRTEIVLVPKKKDPDPIPLDLDPQFEDSAAGAQKRREWEEFQKTGQRVEFTAGTGGRLDAPPQLRNLIPEVGDLRVERVSLSGSGKLDPPLKSSLEAREGNRVVAEVPYIEFGRIQAGTDEATIDNSLQSIPFHVYLTLSKTGQSDRMSFRFALEGSSLHWAVTGLAFLQALSRGGSVHLLDLEDGTYKFVGDFAQGAIPPLPDEFLGLLRRAKRLEELVGAKVQLPRRGLFTNEDVFQLELLERLFGTGELRTGIGSVDFTLAAKGQAHKGVIDHLLGDAARDFEVTQPTFPFRFLDTDLLVGPLRVSAARVEIHPDDRARAMAFRDSASEGEQIRLRIVPSEGSSFVVRLVTWPTGALPPEA